MMKKFLLTFVFIIPLVFEINSQEPPILLNATVINEDGDIRLKWERPDTNDADLIISRDYYDKGDWVVAKIKQITDREKTSWIDTNTQANNKTHIYKLAYNLGEGTYESNYFNTIHTKLKFDTCKKNITLKWTRYINEPSWKDFNDTIKIKEYKIWREIDNNNLEQIGTNNPNDTTFIDESVNYNHYYSYFIEAVRALDTTIKSASNRVSIYTQMAINPAWINTEKLEVSGNQINLNYTIEENSELNRYKLLRSNQYTGNYDTITEFNTSEFTVNYSDHEVNLNNVYYYHLASINECNHLTTRSDTINNIILQVENSDLINNLSWNPVESQDITIYNIYRKIGGNSFTKLDETSLNSYTDSQLELFRGRDSSGRFCYHIEAELINTQGRSSVSISSEKCIYIKPRIFIPNAFTPNNDGINDEFRPVFSFLPNYYLLVIYDRTGRKVFESKDPENPWRGYIQGGSKAAAGTYIYYLEVKNPNNKQIKRRGQINLLYP